MSILDAKFDSDNLSCLQFSVAFLNAVFGLGCFLVRNSIGKEAIANVPGVFSIEKESLFRFLIQRQIFSGHSFLNLKGGTRRITDSYAYTAFKKGARDLLINFLPS